ncbi:MAG TPA: transglycosylase domain-containing protein [Actinomycetota bacterium]|nr:transglycosylase domain-containing protein [Actinomycetota bacterium]
MQRRAFPVAVLCALALVAQACDLPDLKEEREKAEALPQTTFLYAEDGTLITPLHAGEDRVVVKWKDVPEVMADATVAIEDQRFWDHAGVDLKALLRAAYTNVTEGGVVQGASTITQQLVKNLYVGGEVTLSRKFKEAYLAWKLEQEQPKEEILTEYLNTVYFGNGAYGVQAAARTYFGIDATDLNLPQAALLAGVIRSPSDYDPVTHPQRARNRRARVLDAMLSQGLIDQATRDAAVRSRLGLEIGGPKERRYIAPYFVDFFKEWFLSNPRFGETVSDRYDLLFKGGLRITTTLSPRMQFQAERAVRQVLPYARDPYAAMSVIDPRTGYVRAMVGGRDYWDERDRFARINLATGGSTGRQTGSAFKPFALVAALENGLTPSTPLNGSSVSIPLSNGTTWQPQNAEGSGYGTISLETATVNSVNIAYANLEVKLGGGDAIEGAEKIIEVAERMGIRCCPRTTEPATPLRAVPAAVLGANEVSTLEMASAYGTLAYGGVHVQPTPVIRIEDANGDLIYEAPPKVEQAIDPAVASVAVRMLEKVVQYGTGTAARLFRPQFGKTGTEDLYRDAWFVGAIPQLVAAVWVGFPQGQISMQYPRTRIKVFGGTWPAQIWHAFMFNATKRIPVRDFPEPTGGIEYVTVRIDVTQGCVANGFTPPGNVQTLQFLEGTEPTKVCKEPTSYQLLTVPSVIGMKQGEAVRELRSTGFNVAVELVPSSQPGGTVVAQDPDGGSSAQQTSTVTISVSEQPEVATVPDVIGLAEGAASTRLRNAGFRVTVSYQERCDPGSPECDYRSGIVWKQTPKGGAKAQVGSTVTIVVSP